MNEINRNVIEILKVAMVEQKVDLSPNIEWDLVFQELKNQTVEGIPFDLVEKTITLDEQVKTIWRQLMYRKIGFWTQLMYEQEALIQLMKNNGIKIAILKGAAVAVYYPKPEYRTMGDIDFIVKSEDFQKTYQLMLKNGYKLLYDEEHVDYHYTLEKNGICFEIHKKPAGTPEGENGEYIVSLIEDGLDRCVEQELEQYHVPMLPTLQNGLVLLLHIVKHLRSGLGLRQILDWMMFVDKNLDDTTWYSEFQPILHKIKLEKVAMTVARMCQLHLGLRSEDITWCDSVEETICDDLLQYIMEQGNFGRKAKDENGVVRFLYRNKNVLDFIKTIQARGCNNWELAKKYKFFRNFAWLYQIVRYAKLALGRKNAVSSIQMELSKVRDRRKLFQELGMYNITDN